MTALLLMKMLFAVLCLTWLIVPASPCPRVLTLFPTQSGRPCTTLVVRRQRGTVRRRSRVVCHMVRRGEESGRQKGAEVQGQGPPRDEAERDREEAFKSGVPHGEQG